MAPCRFFAAGKCSYGTSCRNPHILAPPDYTILPNSESSQKGSQSSPRLSTTNYSVPSKTPCWFFTQGKCTHGTTCKNSHDIQPHSGLPFRYENLHAVGGIPGGKEDNQQQEVLTKSIPNIPTANHCSREINGAIVNYGAGAEVSNIKFASDFSSIEIAGLAADVKPSTVTKILLDLGHEIDESAVTFKPSGKYGSIAEVRIEDQSSAKDIVRRWEQLAEPRNISIKETTSTTESGTAEKRVQLSTVTCTWYEPSRLAWLTYSEEASATRAIDSLGDIKILDRIPSVNYQESTHADGEKTSCTLCLGNLAGQTTLRDIRWKLFGNVSPDKITLSDPTYKYSDAEAAQRVRDLLETKGELDSFQYCLVSGSGKVKATAAFLDRDSAAKAVRDLHNTSIKALANTKLFVNHIVSVKYNIPTPITRALKVELDQLANDLWQSGHVQLKIYQEDPSKAFTTARLFWENLKSISGAKVRLEKLLAGVLVMKGEEPLWDICFLNSAALVDLAALGATHKMYILRDPCKSRLVMYGGSVDARKEVQQALVEKVEALHELEHTIILTPLLLKHAMQGGMERLKSKFGESVRLKVGFRSSTITITGSEDDFRQARALLADIPLGEGPEISSQSTGSCVICLTEAIEPVHTACGHIYCRECFANQASSATDAEIPLRCIGSEGVCKRVFSLNDLESMLSSLFFESLLRTSFDSHIRTRPEDFQYCPTPDCPQIYRPTTTGEIFYCATCLTPICTTCNVISHEGMNCEEWKEIDSEDNRAFQQYKEEHDVRDCPNCKMGIEKTEGCNHMECTRCSAHICWYCMETFKLSGECYRHMREIHEVTWGGGVGDFF